jgi:endonuclease/exonuclease/phosphatase family metal-dependent hydrolase
MKLITWNIQWGRGADGCVNLDRVVADARRLADFDVLCLQEVSSGFPELSGNDGRDQFAGIASLLPDYTAIAGIATDLPGLSGARRCFGNMILSRYPVFQIFRHLLPWPYEPDVQSMQRIALEVTVQTPLGLMRILTTHLEYYSVKQRRAQVQRLRELQQEAAAHAYNPHAGIAGDGPFLGSPRGGPAILTGDFNFLPDSSERACLISAIDGATAPYRDTWEYIHPQMPHAPTVGVHDKNQWPGPPFTFDFIFATEDLLEKVRSVTVDCVSDASDHQPISLELS